MATLDRASNFPNGITLGRNETGGFLAGTNDPNTYLSDVPASCFYLRSNGEFWFKTSTTWKKIYPFVSTEMIPRKLHRQAWLYRPLKNVWTTLFQITNTEGEVNQFSTLKNDDNFKYRITMDGQTPVEYTISAISKIPSDYILNIRFVSAFKIEVYPSRDDDEFLLNWSLFEVVV